MSITMDPPALDRIETIDIQFAEREAIADPGAPEPALPQPLMAQPSETRPAAPSPPPEITPEPAPVQPEVLTQLTPAAAPEETVPAPPAANSDPASSPSDTANTVSKTQLASVLQLTQCQKLDRETARDCPETDSFDRALALAERSQKPPEPARVTFYIERNVLEHAFSQNDRAPHLFPGMDGDLFADPLPKGAYNAEQIRNGLAPLWSKEMKDGFRKPDAE
jgi:hypothetical protein